MGPEQTGVEARAARTTMERLEAQSLLTPAEVEEMALRINADTISQAPKLRDALRQIDFWARTILMLTIGICLLATGLLHLLPLLDVNIPRTFDFFVYGFNACGLALTVTSLVVSQRAAQAIGASEPWVDLVETRARQAKRPKSS